MTVAHVAQLASDGTEDLTKTRWQFSVLIRIGHGKRGATWWEKSSQSIRHQSSRGTHSGRLLGGRPALASVIIH